VGNYVLHAREAGATIKVSRHLSVNGSVDIAAHETSTISIGSDCLFANGCSITSSDVHHVLDATTGERLNPARDVSIGDHVWLGDHVKVMKGAAIGRNSVVGLGSVVTGQFGPGSAIAGVPARVIRSGITWRP
jgi:acetyltransferase-like isoleucine patch superfamily enzyme